jgi:hypothetical protein
MIDSSDALFYTGLYTFLGTFIIAIAGMLYKSKCKNIKCCGCEIERDVGAEIASDHDRMEHGLPPISPRESNRTVSIDRPP